MWEDTVIHKTELNRLIQVLTVGDSIAENVAKAQAEISYKAGINEVVDWINQESKGHISFGRYEKWQSKLKEWGIEG